MSEKNAWNRDDLAEGLKNRKFFQMCPPMEGYLYSGAKVLDVGCGPGPITRDIAAIVHPGPVVGIDRAPIFIEQAVNMLKASQIPNLSFQVGDAYQLDFADGSFDIVLSLNVMVWLQDPVRALQEQRRVTREGGWVLAAMGDYANIIFYPPCPAVDKYLATLPHLIDQSEEGVFMDPHQGRRAVEILSQAGFKEIKIAPFGIAAYPGTDSFEGPYNVFKYYLSLEGFFAGQHRKLMELGLFDEQTRLEAQREIEAWHAHPHALYLQMPFLAAGRVT